MLAEGRVVSIRNQGRRPPSQIGFQRRQRPPMGGFVRHRQLPAGGPRRGIWWVTFNAHREFCLGRGADRQSPPTPTPPITPTASRDLGGFLFGDAKAASRLPIPRPRQSDAANPFQPAIPARDPGNRAHPRRIIDHGRRTLDLVGPGGRSDGSIPHLRQYGVSASAPGLHRNDRRGQSLRRHINVGGPAATARPGTGRLFDGRTGDFSTAANRGGRTARIAYFKNTRHRGQTRISCTQSGAADPFGWPSLCRSVESTPAFADCQWRRRPSTFWSSTRVHLVYFEETPARATAPTFVERNRARTIRSTHVGIIPWPFFLPLALCRSRTATAIPRRCHRHPRFNGIISVEKRRGFARAIRQFIEDGFWRGQARSMGVGLREQRGPEGDQGPGSRPGANPAIRGSRTG